MTGIRPLAVFDIDGVLADVRHRLHHLSSRPKDWASFFAAVAEDPPLPYGVQLATEWAQRAEVVYLSGRPEETRADTEAWLSHHDLPAGAVQLRRTGDRRPARVTKPGLLRRLAGDREVAIVVDDDAAVCAALRQEGWPVLVADWMPPEASPALTEAQERDGRT